MFKIKSDSILEQSVTIYEFIGILFGYREIENISTDRKRGDDYHHNDIQLFVIKRNETEQKKFENQNTIDNVKLVNLMCDSMQKLLSDKELTNFPETQGNESLYTYDTRPMVHKDYLIPKPDGITWEYILAKMECHFIKFDGYKIKDLVRWCNDRYDFVLEKQPYWLIPNSVPDGYIEIKKLPKLLQLAIETHKQIKWKDVDLQTSVGKHSFKNSVDRFLQEKANELEIPSTSKKDTFEISENTADTLRMMIKPDL